MIVVVPNELKFLEGTTVPEEDAPQWSDTTAYKAGDEVVRAHVVYKALKDNTNVDPKTSHNREGSWQFVGPTNLWKCLDWYRNTKTQAPEGAESMTLVVPWDRGTTSFALLGIEAQSVHATLTGENGDVFLDEDIELKRFSSSWWEYDFVPRTYKTTVVRKDNVPFSGTLTVTIAGGERPSLGTLIAGRQHFLGKSTGAGAYGKTLYGVQSRPVNYSTQEFDSTLGTVTYVKRYAARQLTVDIITAPKDADRVTRLLEDIILMPALWIADNGIARDDLTVFGFLKDAPEKLEGPNVDRHTFKIEGIA